MQVKTDGRKNRMDKQMALLKPEDVAQRLNVALVTIYKWAHSGRLPCIKLGKSVRFRQESVEKLLDQREKIAYGKAA